MRSISAWRILNATLLMAAARFAITLALSTITLGVDSAEAPNAALEIAVVAMASLAFSELFVGGIAFAIVVLKLTRRSTP
jgi:hypothetical protein